MRVEVFASGFDISEMLRTYAESRVWLAVGRAVDRVSWLGVRLMREDDHAADGRTVCQIDVWLRGIGLITVRIRTSTPTSGSIALRCDWNRP